MDIKKWLTSWLPGGKKKNVGGNDPFWNRISGDFAGFGSADLYGNVPMPTVGELLAANQDIVFACVNLIGNKLGAVANRTKLCAATRPGDAPPRNPTKALAHQERQRITARFKQFTRQATDVRELVSHGLLDLIDRPNPRQTFAQLVRVTAVSLCLCGDAYWLKVSPKLLPEAVTEVYLLPAQSVELVFTDKGAIECYKYTQPDGTELEFAPERIVHFKYHNPLDPNGGGYSPLASVWQAFQLLRQEQSAWQAILVNMAFPSAIISSKDDKSPLTSAQAERLQKEMRQVFALGNAGGVWVVQDALNHTPISTPPKDAAALSLYENIKTRICNAYHIPKAVLDQTDSTSAMSDTIKRSLEEDCLVPMLGNILETMTLNLCPSPRLFFCADDIVTPDHQLELMERQQRLNEFQANLRTVNEMRLSLGEEPAEGMDKFLFQVIPGGTMGTLPTVGTTRAVSLDDLKKKLLALNPRNSPGTTT